MMGGPIDDDDDIWHEDDEDFEMGEFTEEDLDEWEKDEIANAILSEFTDKAEEKLYTFRDVYKLLETIGLPREEFVSMFAEVGEDFDEDFSDDEMEFDEGMAMPRGGPPPGLGGPPPP